MSAPKAITPERILVAASHLSHAIGHYCRTEAAHERGEWEAYHGCTSELFHACRALGLELPEHVTRAEVIARPDRWRLHELQEVLGMLFNAHRWAHPSAPMFEWADDLAMHARATMQSTYLALRSSAP